MARNADVDAGGAQSGANRGRNRRRTYGGTGL